MTFEQWWAEADEHYGQTPLDIAQQAWEAALTEAISIADKESDDVDSNSASKVWRALKMLRGDYRE